MFVVVVVVVGVCVSACVGEREPQREGGREIEFVLQPQAYYSVANPYFMVQSQ